MANETLSLALQPREITGKYVKRLRKEGILPLGICGRGVEPYPAQIDEREFMRVINKAGFTGLIEITMPGKKKQSAFLQELQRHPVTGRPVHADLKVVDVNRPLEVEVPVVAHGENPLVDKGQALLNHLVTALLVRALPAHIPHQFDVDITTLTDFDQHIYVRDLQIGDDVEILVEGDTVLFSLAHPKVEVAEEPTTEEAAAAEASPSSDEE
jgi:large subunit ribosomal protein L25